MSSLADIMVRTMAELEAHCTPDERSRGAQMLVSAYGLPGILTSPGSPATAVQAIIPAVAADDLETKRERARQKKARQRAANRNLSGRDMSPLSPGTQGDTSHVVTTTEVINFSGNTTTDTEVKTAASEKTSTHDTTRNGRATLSANGSNVPRDMSPLSPGTQGDTGGHDDRENPTRATPVKEHKAHAVKVILSEYDRLFKERFGRAAVIAGSKDAPLAKRIIAIHGEDGTRALLGLFFASDDPWVRASGYTFGAFHSQVNKLVAQRARHPAESVPGMMGLVRWAERMQNGRGKELAP